MGSPVFVDVFDVRTKGRSVVFEFGEGADRVEVALRGRNAIMFLEILSSRILETPGLLHQIPDCP